MAAWDSEYRQVESQANDFAATLLMPLDDFRRQIDQRARPDFDALGNSADRYVVSLMLLRTSSLSRGRLHHRHKDLVTSYVPKSCRLFAITGVWLHKT
jgi:Zn-dependent peptidase ImmA (M78 family)